MRHPSSQPDEAGHEAGPAARARGLLPRRQEVRSRPRYPSGPSPGRQPWRGQIKPVSPGRAGEARHCQPGGGVKRLRAGGGRRQRGARCAPRSSRGQDALRARGHRRHFAAALPPRRSGRVPGRAGAGSGAGPDPPFPSLLSLPPLLGLGSGGLGLGEAVTLAGEKSSIRALVRRCLPKAE